MKCMKNEVTGKIVRVTDDRAEEMKYEGYTFCPKADYKEQQTKEDEVTI